MAVEAAEGYEKRADECSRLARLTCDDLIQSTLLRMKVTYLRTAATLRAMSEKQSVAQ